MAVLYSYWHRTPMTKMLYFSLHMLALRLFFTVRVNTSKFTSDHIQKLFRDVFAHVGVCV